MKKLLLLSTLLLVSCNSQNSPNPEVGNGTHLGGAMGGGTEQDRQNPQSGSGLGDEDNTSSPVEVRHVPEDPNLNQDNTSSPVEAKDGEDSLSNDDYSSGQ